MIKFFRKFRKTFLIEGHFGKYLTYAIGEVLLVVIGILIALSINNWNETRKLTTNVNNVLQTISSNMAIDTLFANNVITFYEENKKTSARIINKEFN